MGDSSVHIKEVIVVEGKDDTAKIKQAVEADTIETNGSAIGDAVIKQIQHAKEKRGVIIFTDPDYPGERIRHIVSNAVPGCKHAFLTKQEAKAKHNKGIGIEHASSTTIIAALAGVYEPKEAYQSPITKQDLLEFGLLGGKRARQRREKLGQLLRIGTMNGKQLLKRLSMFQISLPTFEKAMYKILREEDDE
ncbi:ribonuclease M5 [Radiobacillus sp. PE A8.2]|uniref:ribonuclease M5 n=1 Tax=Radiobacillus sp. PE A8.2 TaxID=3380349 RepID=UPI00388FF146